MEDNGLQSARPARNTVKHKRPASSKGCVRYRNRSIKFRCAQSVQPECSRRRLPCTIQTCVSAPSTISTVCPDRRLRQHPAALFTRVNRHLRAIASVRQSIDGRRSPSSRQASVIRSIPEHPAWHRPRTDPPESATHSLA